ncbi:ABC transporter ATP-binding protein [Clostridium formicaceticum]|uniref:ABC-type quaternary amine transporter n=1 Tax=Clostridium formicaceticum TaxID=1497 RepID=A0AAC9WH06_9CLOT|nr:ABC transporter ATP-binding protein [Clostridium formicaceticum]AOY77827.1 hypothetical protein BJL90_19355 [Clostridium formicaceticum]ARE88438.1 Spermidine/putrescine import ATP-binding protein PotA [Clostridium formicaceticum]
MKIVMENITKTYGSEKVLDHLNLQVEEGKFLSILGYSGAGKSTILKIISGLVGQDKGRVFIDGIDISNYPTENRNIGYIFQSPLLFPHMTVEENIAFGLQVKKWDSKRIRKRTTELIKLLQIEGLEKRLPPMISGGQQQRVAIARALAPEPRILLMDEPFSSLDSKLREEMGALIKEIQEKLNLTIIFVTHDRNESLALSHEIGILLDGNIAQIDTPKNIYYKPNSNKVAKFMGLCNFIPGRIQGNIFYSRLGEFKGVAEEDGKAKLFLRPEQIKICEGDNFKIMSYKITGREIIYRAKTGDSCLLVEDSAQEVLSVGQTIGLIFPNKNLHFIHKRSMI